MTATRDRDSDLDTDAAVAAWDERPVFGSGRGLPWWAAVLLALLLAVAGAVIDKGRLVDDTRLTSFGLYHALFLAGCVLAVLAVRRGNLFGPMVQPPLIFAVTFIPVQFLSRDNAQSTETGAKKLIFEVALPLASSFPWMAGATGATIVLGIVRLLIQRNPNRSARLDAAEDDRPPRRERDRDSDRDRDADARPPRRPAQDREDRPRSRPQQAATRREQAQPQRRPSRDRDDRPEPHSGRGSGGSGGSGGSDRRESRRDDRSSRGEAPPRRNPQRPREQGGRPRNPQQRRRPREDDY